MVKSAKNGFSVRCTKNAALSNTKTCETSKIQLTHQLTLTSQRQDEIVTLELRPDIAEIVAMWPELPVHIKAAVKALIQTHKAEKK